MDWSFTAFGLGALLGFRHAFDPDHLLAVSNFIEGGAAPRQVFKFALFWVLGHSFAILAAFLAVVGYGLGFPEFLQKHSENFVGLALVALGAWSLYQTARQRVHFHHHAHADGNTHWHIHSHLPNGKRAALGAARTPRIRLHDHQHDRRSQAKLFAIGCLHGLAGSGALLGLSLIAIPDRAAAFVNLIAFCFGALGGMALFGVALRWLLARGRGVDNLPQGFAALSAAACLGYGGWLAFV